MGVNLVRIAFLIVAMTLAGRVSVAQYHKIDSLESLLNRADDTVKVYLLSGLAEKYFSINLDKSLQYAIEARTLAKDLKFLNGEFEALRSMSETYTRKGDFRNSLTTDKQCLLVAERMKDKGKIALAKGYLGLSYRYLNYHSKAFEELTQAIQLFNELGDKSNEADFSISIGNIYLNLNEFEAARKYYQQAIELSDDDPHLKHVVSINLGEIFQEEGKFEKSDSTLDIALQFFETKKQMIYVAYILYLKAKGYYRKGDTDRAKTFFQRTLLLYDELQNASGRSRCLLELGNISLDEKNYKEAVTNYEAALTIVKDQKKYSHLEKIYKGLVSAYQSLGNFEKSLQNQVLATICRDSLNAISQRDKLTELQILYENELAEKEIAQLKAEREDYYLIIGLLVLLCSATIIIVTLLLRKHKANVQVAEATRMDLHQELMAKEEIAQNLKSELEFKVKELTSFTLNMIQKKEMLESIKAGIEEVKMQTEGEAKARLNRILSTITFSQRLDKDWDNFRLYFEQVHQGFFDHLRAVYPDLNSNDLRLCALLRLNLDTKQIASVMDIAPESAKVAKHRIRKKLGLSNSDNLHLFFSSIGTDKAKVGTQ
jgi:tetratricopeptide (TPR) repeat protein/DNA-binding CsgD family transcriptional regulator